MRISIHALREESDLKIDGIELANIVFQSTPSARRATHRLQLRQLRITISIHALREESDCRFLHLSAA